MDLIFYEGAHNVTFGDIDTYDTDGGMVVEKDIWKDFGLVPASKPVVPPPQVKTMGIEIPGGMGVINLTNFLTGYPLFNNRTGSIEFIQTSKPEDWAKNYHELLGYLHGKQKFMKIDGEDCFYKGLFSVNSLKTDKVYSTITIDYNVDAYAYTKYTEFEMVSTGSNTSKNVMLESPNSQPIKPDFYVELASAANLMAVSFYNPELDISKTFTLLNGKNSFGGMIMLSNFSGSNECTITIMGNGKVKISYLEGII